MKKIAYYITAHGYGHGTRSCDILNALRNETTDVPIIVITDLPPNFIKSRLKDDIELRPGAFDVGLVQKDAIQVDLNASLEATRSIYACEQELIDREMLFMERENIGVVVSDIPAIPLAAAQQADIPNIATGNFGWDWIYADFARTDPHWKTYVDKFRKVYRKTGLLLRLPFAEPMAAFPKRIDLPLLAKPGTANRKRIARFSGADPAKKWILLSFVSLDLDAHVLENLSHMDKYDFFSVEPLEWPGSSVRCISRSVASFADILASMDVVVAKPGFGIVSECIVNNKPIIYTERRNFREYNVLVDGINRYCRNAYIPGCELYAGRLEQALETIDSAPDARDQIARGGAEIAARHILRARAYP